MRTLQALVLISLLAAGCATATPTQKGALGGSAVGAGLGAIIGHQSGRGAEGALIGAAAGGLGGALLGDAMAAKFCSTCGRDFLSTDPDHCPFDGNVLRPKGAPAQTTQQQQGEATLPKFCSSCGKSYPAEANHCSMCGTALKTKQ